MKPPLPSPPNRKSQEPGKLMCLSHTLNWNYLWYDIDNDTLVTLHKQISNKIKPRRLNLLPSFPNRPPVKFQSEYDLNILLYAFGVWVRHKAGQNNRVIAMMKQSSIWISHMVPLITFPSIKLTQIIGFPYMPRQNFGRKNKK